MKKTKNRFQKPNIIIYGILLAVCKLIAKFKFNLKIEKNEIKKLKGSYVVIANHESSIDFINMVCATNRRLSFVISNSFYQSLKIHWLIKQAGVIAKQQFQTSPTDLKKMKEAINNKRHLVIYPAGLMTANGIATPVPEATGKFLKWLNTDVYVAKTTGSYFTNPKWGKGFRKGKITLNITKLFSKEDLENKESEDIQRIVYDSLYYDAYKYQEKDLISYKNGNNIKGLENVLYWCPKCNHYFTNKNIDDSTMRCEHCGNEVNSDNYGFLHPKTNNDICFKHPSDWYRELYKKLYFDIQNDENYTLYSPMTLKMLDYKKHQFIEVSKGSVKLDKDKFVINYQLNDSNIQKEIPIKTIPILPSKPGVHFEIQDGHEIYRCCLDNGSEVTKWMDVLNIFYEINKNKYKY